MPNLPFLALMIFACPKRSGAVVLYLLVTMLSRKVPGWATVALLVLAVCIDTFMVIAGVFDLAPSLLLESIRYAVAFDFFGSAAYMLAVAVLVTTTAASAWLLIRFRKQTQSVSLLPAILAAIAIFATDVAVNMPSKNIEGLLGILYSSRVPFTSAMEETGFEQSAVADGHNLLVVVVEGMGAFAAPEHQALLTRLLETKKLEKRYAVTSGTSSYVGSTTGAESRELCSRWGDFRDYLGKPHYDCLPARMVKAGYEATSFHAFTGNFFERNTWYPHVGFQHDHFMEDLVADGTDPDPSFCGLTFKGLCDADVSKRVRRYLDRNDGKPRFAYWLTLNTHMPIAPGTGTPRLSCDTANPFADHMVCDMTEMWMDVMDDIAAIASDPDLPPTDIVIVGDHTPPLWTRSGRNAFAPGKVAWYALKARTNGQVAHDETSRP
ncbi:sulfatase-like hydrolase/transferase [Breoghania sp. JC706]|uniref:sulfatase-like hydrolase/transferase n=1 Tax=Breoghania sp. JC706 TaxID=3117732 RepID=UPI003008C80E